MFPGFETVTSGYTTTPQPVRQSFPSSDHTIDHEKSIGINEALSVEPNDTAPEALVHEHGQPSAHTIDRDSWKQLGLLLITSCNNGYILTFSNLMLVPLGWTWGVISLLVLGFYGVYSSCLLAGFHFIDGQRFIRFRDLMGFLFGRKMFYVTWSLQMLTMVLANMGFILLGGRALKEINSDLSGGSPWRLQYFIIITGVSYFIFSVLVPTISSMGKWLAITITLTFSYVVVLLVALVKDGKSIQRRDYDIKGDSVSKVLNAFGAMAAITACSNSGMVPEMQSTLRKPAVDNMRKALYSQFSVGLLIYYGVAVAGYWAYGASVSEYLPKQLSEPKWVKVLINAAVFAQSVISQHLFVAPVHEALDTRFLNLEKRMHSGENFKRLLYVRAFLYSCNTLVATALPFMGDFVNLFGSVSLIPLTFIFPSMIFIKVKGKMSPLHQKVWHWGNIVMFSLLGVASTASALRLIIINVKQYRFFADT